MNKEVNQTFDSKLNYSKNYKYNQNFPSLQCPANPRLQK